MMSDQLTASLNLSVQSTGFNDNKNYNFTDLLSLQAMAGGIQIATTAYAALTIGDMASTDIGVMVLHNLDTNNYCTYGSTLGEFKLDPQEFAFVRIAPGKTIQIMANTANVKVEKYIVGK
jgi:hypothetical protein